MITSFDPSDRGTHNTAIVGERTRIAAIAIVAGGSRSRYDQTLDSVSGHRSVPDASQVAGVAQSVEQLICNQPVAGSNPVTSLSQTPYVARGLRYCHPDQDSEILSIWYRVCLLNTDRISREFESLHPLFSDHPAFWQL